jgi:hypothetical protein
VPILPDKPQNLDSSDELSGEHFDLSDQSNDLKVVDDSSPFEEEKKAPLKPIKYKSTTDLNSLSNNEIQALWCTEIDRLIEISEFLADH